MEVRKAAVAEVQRAVANAESKAQELVNAERSRIEGLMREVARREAAAGEQKIDAQQVFFKSVGWVCIYKEGIQLSYQTLYLPRHPKYLPGFGLR